LDQRQPKPVIAPTMARDGAGRLPRDGAGHQMGHAGIQITVDTYGSAFPFEDQEGVAVLDDPPAADASGSKVVATRRARTPRGAQARRKASEPYWERTSDPLLKRRVDSASVPYAPGLEPRFFADSPTASRREQAGLGAKW
jgi:hypothetical protein